MIAGRHRRPASAVASRRPPQLQAPAARAISSAGSHTGWVPRRRSCRQTSKPRLIRYPYGRGRATAHTRSGRDRHQLRPQPAPPSSAPAIQRRRADPPPALGPFPGSSAAGPTTATALAKQEQISPQSMGETLAILEQRGLIARVPDPDDGRRVILSLTDAGRAAVHAQSARPATPCSHRCSPPNSPPRSGRKLLSGRAANRAPGTGRVMAPVTAPSGTRPAPPTTTKWVAAREHHRGGVISQLDGSIVLIAMPAIFQRDRASTR